MNEAGKKRIRAITFCVIVLGVGSAGVLFWLAAPGSGRHLETERTGDVRRDAASPRSTATEPDSTPDPADPRVSGLILSGEVRTPGGELVAGAIVSGFDLQTTTDEHGAFSLAVPEALADGPVARLVATAPGWAKTETAVTWSAVDRIVIVLRPDGRVSGYVCDDTLRGIPGAHIEVTSGTLSFEGRTDEHGKFVIGSIPGDHCEVLARATGYLPRRVSVVPGAEDRTVRIVLEAGVAMAVRVVTEAGEPIAGATVECHFVRNAMPTRYTTGADGLVQDYGIHPQGGTIRASAPGRAAATLSLLFKPLPPEVELVLRPDAVLVVRQKRRSGQRPAAETWVVSLYELDDDNVAPRSRRFSAEGKVEFAGCDRGAPYGLLARMQMPRGGLVESAATVISEEVVIEGNAVEIEWAPPQWTELTVACREGDAPAPEGTSFVLNRANQREMHGGFEGATRDTLFTWARDRGPALEATLGHGGAVTVWIPPGSYLFDTHPSRAVAGERPIPVEVLGGRQRVEIAIPRVVALSGELRRVDGRPVPYAEVAAKRRTPGGPAPLVRTRTDADGKFVLRGLVPGEYTVYGSGVRGDLGGVVVNDVAVPGDAVRIDVPAHTVRGRIPDADGERFRITAVPAAWTKRDVVETWSDENGRFVIHDLSERTWSISGYSWNSGRVRMWDGAVAQDMEVELVAR